MTGAKTNPTSFANRGIQKAYNQSKITKPRNRLSLSNSDKTTKGSTLKSSLPKPRPCYRQSEKKINHGGRKEENQSKNGPIFKEVIPMRPKNRNVFGNLSNSPNVMHEKKQKKIQPTIRKEDIKFEEDPNALASILNNEGITTKLLQENGVIEGRPSMVSNNTYLFLDGRPSLCRRVPINRKQPNQVNRRETVCGPRRVLLSAKKGIAPRLSVGHRNKLQQPYDRHSLYSVIQGRYSNADSNFREGRLSLQAGKKSTVEPKQEKNSETLKMPFKSPPAVRVQSRMERISASPALRVKQPVHITPLPQRSTKKCSQRGVTWKDENLLNSKVNLVTNLFQDASPTTTPMQGKLGKTPVSILRNRKHSKRNSLTPPLSKKNREYDDYSVEDIVKPLVINETEIDENENKVSNELKMAIAAQSSARTKQEKLSLGFSAKKTKEMRPKVLQKSSPVWSKFPKPETNVATKEAARLQESNAEMERVFKIMSNHVTKVKRRSVQSELSTIMSKIQSSLKEGGLHEETIEEDAAEIKHEELPSSDKARSAIRKAEFEQQAKAEDNPQSPIQERPPPSSFPLTPGTIKDIRENGGEKCREDFDRIALETERINEELRNLQLEKERLNAFQEKIKNFRSQRVTKLKVPQLVTSEKLPVAAAHQIEPTQLQEEVKTKVQNQLSTSWDKLLKSDMKSSPPSHPNDVTSRSLDTGSVSPFKRDCKVKFLGTASPHISALHLERAKSFEVKKENFQEKNEKFQENKRNFWENEKSLNCERVVTSSNEELKKESDFSENRNLGHPSELALPSYSELFHKAEAGEPAPLSADLDFSFMKPLPPTHPPSKFGITKVQQSVNKYEFKAGSAPFASDLTALSSIKASPASSESASQISPLHSSQSSAANLQRIKSQLEKPVFIDFSSPTQSFGSSNIPRVASTPGLFAPDPIMPKPMQTPAVFRKLRVVMKASPANPTASVKQQFAHALLDEEVSLLTCRVVRPSDLLQANQDPVAHSLYHGDEKHFVPIVKTPSGTPRHNKRSSFGDSAFSKYLRM